MKKWMILTVLATILGAFMTGCSAPADAGAEGATNSEKPAGETATSAEGGSAATEGTSTEAPAHTDAGATDGAATTEGAATEGAATEGAAANAPAAEGEHKEGDDHGHAEGEAKTEGGH